MAYAQEIDGEFFVLRGSQTRDQWIGSPGGYQALFLKLLAVGCWLLAVGILAPDADGTTRFTDDYAFNSPSAAASIVAGRSSNGRTNWTVEQTGQTYGDWQDQQLSLLTPAVEIL